MWNYKIMVVIVILCSIRARYMGGWSPQSGLQVSPGMVSLILLSTCYPSSKPVISSASSKSTEPPSAWPLKILRRPRGCAQPSVRRDGWKRQGC